MSKWQLVCDKLLNAFYILFLKVSYNVSIYYHKNSVDSFDHTWVTMFIS